MPSFIWLTNIFAFAALIYLLTFLVGLLGNCWVVASVLRTTKKTVGCAPSGTPSISPSDRLRKYIWLLAALDLLVTSSLLYRIWAVLMPGQSHSSCQLHFALDQLFKLCSLTCLASISIERYITIKKPFNNKVRKLAVQLTPLFAFLSLLLCGSAICWLAWSTVLATDDGLNCTQRSSSQSILDQLANWMLAIGFCTQLAMIGTNYARIVRHVRRKFWQRKARAVAHSFSTTITTTTRSLGQSLSGDGQRIDAAKLAKKLSPPLLIVAQPKYMREMTTAIMRIAIFHLLCWLPFCLLQLAPALQNVLPLNLDLDDLKSRSSIAIRIFDARKHGLADWVAFIANWLTYANSASNWVLYAALNRDLRSIIKACSERRKRSTLSHHSPTVSGHLLRKSVRRNAFHTIRLFYSLNSHRSSASMEYDNPSAVTILAGGGCQHQQPGAMAADSGQKQNSSLRAPCGSSECAAMRKQSAQSSISAKERGAGEGKTAESGTFGWRHGRAHTYCAPREEEANSRLMIMANGNQSERAHLRVAQQIIAAVYKNNGNSLRGRRESAAERRELFAKMRTTPPPIHIVSIMGASSSTPSSNSSEEGDESIENPTD